MSLETGTYISDLVATNPDGADAKSQGDDHLKLVKATLLATFPNITGAVTPTHTQLNELYSKREWDFIVSQAISGSPTQVDFVHGSGGVVLDGTYSRYRFELVGLQPATDNVYMWVRVGSGGGPTYQTTGYAYGGRHIGPGGSSDFGSDAALDNDATRIRLVRSANGISNSDIFEGVLHLGPSLSSAGTYKKFWGQVAYTQTGTTLQGLSQLSGAYMGGGGALTAVRFAFSSGAFANSGRISLYGLRTS